ncbi:hypothetical protein HMPREF1861_02175 [Corynebacterium kroppenstedtii]|nr:hypothetical protein HMPREF1861_02175 [Corynebacterium kroppenstedtii]
MTTGSFIIQVAIGGRSPPQYFICWFSSVLFLEVISQSRFISPYSLTWRFRPHCCGVACHPPSFRKDSS